MKKFLFLAVAAAIAFCSPAFALTCQDGFRAFTHFSGDTCVPNAPKRIVTLHDTNLLVTLLELGVVPIGSAGEMSDAGTFFRTASRYDTSKVTHVGSYLSPDIEAVAALKPDLILATPFQNIEPFKLLAPTVVIDMHETPLEEAMLQLADIVNEKDQALALKAKFDARVKEARAQLGEDFAKTTISVIMQYGETPNGFYAVSPGHSTGLIRRALRPTVTPLERGDWEQSDLKSLEALPDHAADVIFYYGYDVDPSGHSELLENFKTHPLSRLLPAVKAGQVFNIVNHDASGATWAMVSEELENYLSALLREDLNRDLVQE